MSDIPDDIMKAANECVAEFRWNNDNRWHMFVARAILAERERSRQLLSEAEKREREAKAKALEDAAKVAEDLPTMRTVYAGQSAAMKQTAPRDVAAAIRALQSEER